MLNTRDQKTIPESTIKLIASFKEIIKNKQYEKIFEFEYAEMQTLCKTDKKTIIKGLTKVFNAATKEYKVFYADNFAEDLVNSILGVDPLENASVSKILKIKSEFSAIEKKRQSYFHAKDYIGSLKLIDSQIKLAPFANAQLYGTRASFRSLMNENYNNIFNPILIDLSLAIWFSIKGPEIKASIIALYYYQRFSLYKDAKNIPQLTKNLFLAAKAHPADLNIKNVVIQCFDLFDKDYLKQFLVFYSHDDIIKAKLKAKGLYDESLVPKNAEAPKYISLLSKPLSSQRKSKAINYLKYAKFYYQSNDLESAISYSQQALKRDPTNPEIYLLLFLSFRNLGEAGKALSNLNWMKMNDPNNKFEYLSEDIKELEAKRLQEEKQKLLESKHPIKSKEKLVSTAVKTEEIVPLKSEAELKAIRDQAKAARLAKLRAERLARKPAKDAKIAEDTKKLQEEKEKLDAEHLKKELEKLKTRKEKRAAKLKLKLKEEIKLELPKEAKILMDLLPNKNIYVVGGAVRDLLVGDSYRDLDMISDATPEEIEALAKKHNLQIMRWKLEDGLIVYRITINRTPIDLRLTANLNSLEQDAFDRDITANALYLNRQGMVIDPLGTGIHDAKNDIIKFINLDKNCFQGAKALKLLRVVNHIIALDLDLSAHIKETLMQNKANLSDVAPHRVNSTLNKLFTKGYSQTSFEWLNELGFLDILFPKIFPKIKNSIWLLNEIAQSDILEYPSLNYIFMVMVVSSLEKPSVAAAKQLISEEPIINARLSVMEDLDLKLANTIGKWNCYHVKAQASQSTAVSGGFFRGAAVYCPLPVPLPQAGEGGLGLKGRY